MDPPSSSGPMRRKVSHVMLVYVIRRCSVEAMSRDAESYKITIKNDMS